jgi:hypothetical protein
VSAHPAPLTPADADLQDFPFMPLHVARLRDSDLAAEESPEACWYAVLLWAASWHQLPAGSLPDNDAILMRLVGLGRDARTWKKHSTGALRGFVQCSDGRLYHPVVAEQVNSAWQEKLAYRDRKEKRQEIAKKAAAARWGDDAPAHAPQDAHAQPMHDAFEGDASCMADAMPKERGTERGTGTGNLNDDVGASEKIEFVWPADALELSNELTRLAGVPNVQPSSISRNLTVVQDWLKDGMDPAADIVPVISQVLLDTTDRISSLRFFDGAVRQTKARAAASAAGGKPSKVPSKPLTAEERIAQFERSADMMARMGRHNEAQEERQKANELRQAA